jgi:hypothetical protein
MHEVGKKCAKLFSSHQLMDQMPSEEVRKRLVTMSKRSCYDDEDRMCLLQIVTLINNLEVLSQQQDHPTSNESSLDSIVVSGMLI